MSLSEYRRRRGLSTASVESSGETNKVQAPPPPGPISVPHVTSIGSPGVDLKRLSLPDLPPVPSSCEPILVGPRTPSESPSEEDDSQGITISSVISTIPLQSHQLLPLPIPASLSSPSREDVERFHNSFCVDIPIKPPVSLLFLYFFLKNRR